jgi:DNA-binding NarL/FixJ family response regulator
MGTKLNAALTDPARLYELRSLRLLDTAPEPTFDRLTRLAARLLRSPVALVSLVDDRRQFFKSSYGLPEPWLSRRETPISQSFCQHVVIRAAPLVIEDARLHPLVYKNLAITKLNVIAYLGVPLMTARGANLGSFCVIDSRPRSWSDDDIETMLELAQCVITEIDLRECHKEQKRFIADLRERDEMIKSAQSRIVDEQHLIDAIHHALKDHGSMGEIPAHGDLNHHHENGFSPQAVAQKVLESQRALLTDRQRGVFDLLMHGLQTKEVARQLNLSPRTVEVHRAHILKRLNATSFTQLISQLLNYHDEA